MTSEQWDGEAETFDDEPDHGLRDETTRAAWRDLLLSVLPPAPARIATSGAARAPCHASSWTRGTTSTAWTFPPP